MLIGLLEREIRLHLDLKVHLYKQGFENWLSDVSELTSLSPEYFQGLTGELLGMPGFCAAYTIVTNSFEGMPLSLRKKMLNEFPDIDYFPLLNFIL